MNLKPQNNTTSGIKFSIDRTLPHFGVPLVIVALMVSGLLVTAARALTLQDPQPEDSTTRFGQSLAVIGDINGDGIPDLVVGGPFHDSEFSLGAFGPPQDVGRAFILNGATLGEISELNDPFFQQPLEFPKFGGFFGFSVAAVGDLNHDGVPDILVGAPHHSNFDADRINCGEAMVFSGANHSVLFTLNDPDEDEGSRFGYAVAGLGDVNGDGVPDMLVGVPKANGSVDDVGAAYIFSGANGSLIRSLNPPTEVVSGRFGSAVANAGDVNHDGVNDAIIGAPGASRAFVFSGANGALLFTIASPAPPNQDKVPSFGYAVAGGQDIDGDGTPDFVIGAPNQNSLKGAAYVFKGSDGTLFFSGPLTNPTHKFAKFGTSVALTPDVTGDGRPDILVGAPDATVNGMQNAGEVLLYRGNNGRLVRTIISEQPKAFAGFGFAVTTADFNGDGTPEIVVGVPFEDVDIINGGDVETHLQMGQIEIH